MMRMVRIKAWYHFKCKFSINIDAKASALATDYKWIFRIVNRA